MESMCQVRCSGPESIMATYIRGDLLIWQLEVNSLKLLSKSIANIKSFTVLETES